MVCKFRFVPFLLALLLPLFPRLSSAVTVYDLDFEEPVHHAGAGPTLGSAPDKVSKIVFGTPTVVVDPGNPDNQALELRAGTTYSQIELDIPAGLTSSYTLAFDVYTKEMSGSNYGFDVLLDTSEIRSLSLHGPLRQIYTFNPYVYTGTHSIPFADDTPYHISIQVDTVVNQWLVTVNGAEICRQAFNASSLASIRFNVSPMYGNSPVSTAPRAYLDNVTLTDSRPNFGPTFTLSGGVTVEEDSGPHTYAGWAKNMRTDLLDPALAQFDFRVSNSNPTLFAVQPTIAPDGTLDFTPAANAFGQATVTVRLHDNGGTAGGRIDTSSARSFPITVNSVNDAPTLDPLPPLTLLEGAASQRITLSGISSGAPNEKQSLFLWATSSNPALIPVPAVTYHSPDTTGLLTFQPTSARHGTADITVWIQDSGGGRTARTFTVAVQHINNPPTFTKGGDISVLEDAGPQRITAWASEISPGSDTESDQALSFIVTTDSPFLFQAGPAISADGELTFTPAPDANGIAHVTVTLKDDGGTEAGGIDASAPENFSITIRPVNDAPEFLIGPDITVGLGDTSQVHAFWARGILAGPSNERGQAVHFVVSVDHPELFAEAPALAPNGTLTFTPGRNSVGTAIVTVRAVDDGPRDAPDVNTSAPQSFAIHVTRAVDLSGKYTALIQPAAAGPVAPSRVGLLSFTVTRNRRFTGRLTLPGKTHVFLGHIDLSGQAVFGPQASQTCVLKRPGRPDLKLQFLIDQDSGTFKVNGSLTERGEPFAEIRGDRALFTAGEESAPFRHVAAEMLGSYKVVFGPQTDSKTFPEPDKAKGTGTLTLSSAGVATLIATFSDGTKVSCGNFVSIDGEWPLYVPLNRGAASISGPVLFRHLDSGSDVDAQTIHWFNATHWPFLTEISLLGTKAESISGR